MIGNSLNHSGKVVCVQIFLIHIFEWGWKQYRADFLLQNIIIDWIKCLITQISLYFFFHLKIGHINTNKYDIKQTQN